MLRTHWLATLGALAFTQLAHAEAPPIEVIASATPTELVARKPGNVYVGEKINFVEDHNGNVQVKIGLWEADVSRTYLEDYPFTEYVLMISGHLVVTNTDGTVNEFRAGDTFVIPRGFSGEWDIRERMKKQMVQVGDPTAKPTSRAILTEVAGSK